MGVPLTVNVPQELDDRYKAMARERFVSKSDVIREALMAHVQKQTGAPIRFSRRPRAKKEAI